MKANEDIRAAAKAARVYLWQIANEMGVADHTLSRMMRKELSKEKKDEAFSIIDRLAKEGHR